MSGKFRSIVTNSKKSLFSAAGFFENGIEYLSQLVQANKYAAAIRVLHDMSGILVRSVDYLIENTTYVIENVVFQFSEAFIYLDS